MNKLILLILSFLYLTAKAQKEAVPLPGIEFYTGCMMYKGDLYAAGDNYKNVKKHDGYSTLSWIYRLGADLHPKWALKIEKPGKSTVRKITVVNDTVYALVEHGRSTHDSLDVYLRLYVISAQGKIIQQADIGKDYFSGTSNIVVDKGKVYFAYTETPQKSWSYMGNYRTIFAEYDLKTKKVIRTQANNENSYLCRLFKFNEELVLVSVHDYTTRMLVKILNAAGNAPAAIKEKVFTNRKGEYLLDAFTADNDLVIVTTFPGVYGDMEKYVKISRVNRQSYSKSDKVIFYKDCKWDDIDLKSFTEKESTWLYIKDVKGTKSFVQVDKTGAFVASIAQKPIENVHEYIITDQHQYLFIDQKMLIANEKKAPLASK